MRKKYLLGLVLILALACFFTYYMKKENQDKRAFNKIVGIKLPVNHQILLDEDTHRGFHGDGERKIILQLTQEQQNAIENDVQNNSNWQPLPLTGNTYILAYGGSVGNTSYGYEFLKEWVPETSKGAFLIRNRDPITSKRFPRDIFPNNKYSFNFDFVLWDQSLRILYLYQSDM